MQNSDLLARFAVKQEDVTKVNDRHRAKLFSPNSKGESSVCRITELIESEIKKEGFCVVKNRQDAELLYGWALLWASKVREIGLKIKNDPAPSRHSDIIWPSKRDKRSALRRRLINYCFCGYVPLSPPLPPPLP